MNDWLLHMSEAQRNRAAGLLDAVIEGLEGPSAVHRGLSPSWSRLMVRSLPDRRAGASAILSGGVVVLRTPLSPRRLQFAAEILGPVSEAAPIVPDRHVAAIMSTLRTWRTALAPPDRARAAEVEAMSTAARLLLTGIAQALQPDWELASLRSTPEEGHVVRVFSRAPNGSQRRLRFVAGRPGRLEGGMSAELVAAIDRIVGSRSHANVVEDVEYQRFHLRFGATRTFLARPASDPMAILRALGSMPSGARLLPPP